MMEQARQVAMRDQRLFEDFRLSGSDPARVREVSVVGTAYDSIICNDLTYVSTPITSGAALYAAMDAAGVTSVEEVKRDADFFRDNVILPNLAAAEAVANRMASSGGAVIAPAAFEARSLGWSQDDYMGLWLDVIERKATRLAMVDGWQYSNGGAEEYLQALLMQAGRRDRDVMEIVDADGNPIGHLQALRLLAEAVEDVLDRNFVPTILARTLHRCVILHNMVGDEMQYGISTDRWSRRTRRIPQEYMDAQRDVAETRDGMLSLRDVLQEARSLLDASEMEPRSSMELAPGLVRTTGRGQLAERPARVITSQEEE